MQVLAWGIFFGKKGLCHLFQPTLNKRQDIRKIRSKQINRGICSSISFFSLLHLRGAVSAKKVDEVGNVDRCGDLFAVVSGRVSCPHGREIINRLQTEQKLLLRPQ
jgi:hypothetical protein